MKNYNTTYASFVKEEERKLKVLAIREYVRIVGHKPEIQVLHDPFNLPTPKRGKREISTYISLAKAREIVREELILRQGGVKMQDGNIRYHFVK